VLPTNATVTYGGLSLFEEATKIKRTPSLGQTAELGAELFRLARPTQLPDMEVIGYTLASISLAEIPQAPLVLIARHIEWNVSRILMAFQPLCR
jgi:hypothetical protein